MRALRDLWANSPRRAALVVALTVLGAAGQASAAALAGSVLLHRSFATFIALAAALLAAVLTDVTIGLLMASVTADWTAAVRRSLCTIAFGQPLPKLEGTPVGELLDRIDGDVYQVGSQIRGGGVRLARSAAFAIASVITALIVWWPAGLTMAALSVLLVARLRKPVARIEPLRVAEEESWSDLAAVMEEAIHGQDDVRTSLARPYVLKLFAKRSSEVLRRGRLVWEATGRLTMVAAVIMRCGIAAVVIFGAWAMGAGLIDGARLTAVWLLSLAFSGTVEHVSRALPELQNALGAWARVQQLRDSVQEPVGGRAPSAGDIGIQQLTFSYHVDDSRRTPALQGVDLNFKRGRSYAVIGRTGSGKSTLAKVLTRSVEVPRGCVFVDGTDLVDLDLVALRRWVAIVPQRTEIVAGTLAENVALFDPELHVAAAAAIDELGLTDWVADLPDGMDTKLGAGGYVLSAGQEQLVAFARVLLRAPQVVILDEATARMDPVTEARVHGATQRLLRGRIGLIIAHRLSSVSRCDEIVVLADGKVLEAGPLAQSQRFARLLAQSGQTQPNRAAAAPSQPTSASRAALDRRVALDHRAGPLVAPRAVATETLATETVVMAHDQPEDWEGELLLVEGSPQSPPAVKAIATATVRGSQLKGEPPPLPSVPPVRTLHEIYQLTRNDPRFGLAALAVFFVMLLFGFDGSLLPRLWVDLVDGVGSPFWPVVGILICLAVLVPAIGFTSRRFPEWWVRQMLRISLRLVYGQTGPRRVSEHTPAEVIAQSGDTERVVVLADNLIDQFSTIFVIVTMTLIAWSPVPALFFLATTLISGLVALAFGPVLARSAKRTVAARAAFSTGLASALGAARTVKLNGATEPVLGHLARLDAERSSRQRVEISAQVLARSTPSIVSGLLPIGAWALYLSGGLSPAATLIAVSTLGSASWLSWTTASLVSSLPSARVWTRRTVSMSGGANYSAAVGGVDISAGTAPAPVVPQRQKLRWLELKSFTAVHEDGTIGAHEVDLTVKRGQLVLLVGQVGSGKSSLLRAMAGIVHHTGTLSWNGRPVTEPELFLRPNQVGYVGQIPRVLSGTVADNIELGHRVDTGAAVSAAQLDYDLAVAGGGLGLLIGHKGTRLSGGQLQRLALARALAPSTELLIADDVSSALDVATELELWRALRSRGVTVVGSTFKRAALAQADVALVMIDGRIVARGRWDELAGRWGHLAG